MHAITQITDQLTLVMLDIRIWSGRKKLRAEDLRLSGDEIPPEDLVSLGSKRVCDPESLKAFYRLKQGAERACLRVGTRFLGGFAIPQDQAELLAARLAALKTDFDVKTAAFLADYDRALEQWIGSLPEFEEPIRRAIEPANVVGGRLHFGYQLIQVSPAEQPGTLAEEVQSLGDGIFSEVGQLAKELEGSFEGKAKLHRRALGTVARIREKLACLAFIDPRIQPVVDTIDDWVSRLPQTGPIEGPIFNEGMGLALLLADPERMARHGAGQMAGASSLVPGALEEEDFQSELEDLFTDLGPEPETELPVPVTEREVESFFF